MGKSNLLIMGGGFALLLLVLCLLKIRSIYKSFKNRDRDTLALGLWMISDKDLKDGVAASPLKPPSIDISRGSPTVLRIKKYNQKMGDRQMMSMDMLGSLSNSFGVRFVMVKKEMKRYSQAHYVYTSENMNLFHYKKRKTLPYCPVIGRTDSNDLLNLDFIEHQSVRVIGRGGSGKSVLLAGIIEGVDHSVNGLLRVLLLNAKSPTDDPALSYLSKSDRVTWLNPLIEEELRESVEVMEDIYACFTTDFDGRSKYKNYMIVIDEASQFLKIEKSDNKQITILKQRLIASVKKHVQLLRFSKIPIVVATQGGSEQEIDITKNIFKIIISSKVSASLSKILVGDGAFLDDPSLESGRFGISIDGNLEKFKAVYLKDFSRLTRF